MIISYEPQLPYLVSFPWPLTGTWEDLYLPLKGVLGAEETRFEDEVQVVGESGKGREVRHV